ncbi:MAG: hypothetical protein ACLQO1_11215 [Steroidobacteraceae bacterium]
MSDIFVYQIYHKGSGPLDPGFRVLDNSTSARPDWFEYWPIRQFLLNEPLEEDAFYGFLSPRFKEKTNLSSAAVFDFLKENSTADIVLMTPSLHLTAYYWNVFQYGDFCHPGLLNLATQFFRRIGRPTNLTDLVTNSRNEVYSNYFFAKPRFWRAWLDITEQLITIAETPADPLGVELRKTTSYRGANSVQMKIFIMERIPTWMLTRDSTFTVVARDPFVVRSRVYKVPGAVVCDALKLAYTINGRQQQYRDLFNVVSKMAKIFALQIRFGNLVGFRTIRSCMTSLSAYWTKAGKTGH